MSFAVRKTNDGLILNNIAIATICILTTTVISVTTSSHRQHNITTNNVLDLERHKQRSIEIKLHKKFDRIDSTLQ